MPGVNPNPNLGWEGGNPNLFLFQQASDMFGAMRLWDEYVECLIQLGDRTRAEAVVRERLEVNIA